MGEFVKVATVDEIKPGEPFIYDFYYETVVIFQVEDDYYCVKDECTHQDYPLSEGKVVDCRIECALHGSWFDLQTGEALNLPAVKPVQTYRVKVEGNDIYVEEPEDEW